MIFIAPTCEYILHKASYPNNSDKDSCYVFWSRIIEIHRDT